MTPIPNSGERLRVVVLWNALSGYLHAEFAALADAGAEVLVVHRAADERAPFDDDVVTRGLISHPWRGAPDEDEVRELVEAFAPDALLVSSWNIGAYVRIARSFRGRALRVLCMSNQWFGLGRPKQWAGIIGSRAIVRRNFDAALLPGERAADFANRLGIPDERIIWGLNTGDLPTFAGVAERRGTAVPPPAFLFAGRLVADKAIDVLATGYRAYQAAVADPWPLLVAGTGPDEHLLRDVDGVKMLGFVQPADLPAVFAEAGCLVLPSRFEPWGVVIHEAAAAGLPVVCTRRCGASTRLVLDGYNGAVVSHDDPAALASGLARISTADDAERCRMGEASSGLARQYSPERWARNLLRRTDGLRRELGLAP